ncbi:MAG TPA: PIN domain-containing protein [Verrucomicrobiae bacterium]|nr:PIN domain-containing protein [Verrucomicrobiae bacterium]
MAIIIDADVIIRGERGTFDLKGWLQANSQERFELAAITIAELWHGVERATGMIRARREKYLQSIVSPLTIIPYTEEIAYEHARIWAYMESGGKMIGDYDLIIAATALARGSAVATFNQKHFSSVAGLKVIEPGK